MQKILCAIFKSLTVVSIFLMLVSFLASAINNDDLYFGYGLMWLTSAMVMYFGAKLMEEKP